MTFLVFIGSLIWSHSRDPFQRKRFCIVKNGRQVQGIAVMPRGLEKMPLLIYAHGANGKYLSDGNALRTFAALGFAAISFDYDQNDENAFDTQFLTILGWAARQQWVETNKIAVVGFSLGAQFSLGFFLRHPSHAPQAYVRLAGGWVSGLDRWSGTENAMPVLVQCPILLVNGENDEVFPVAETRRVAAALGTNAVVKEIPAMHHDFGQDQGLAFRLIGEWCKIALARTDQWPTFSSLKPLPFWICLAPALIWFTLWLTLLRADILHDVAKLLFCRHWSWLFIAARIVSLLAFGDLILQWALLRTSVTPLTFTISKKCLTAQDCRGDLDWLMTFSDWRDQNIDTLISYSKLARHAAYEVANWHLDQTAYQKWVLSPFIEPDSREMNWRRDLWEALCSQVKDEKSSEATARIVVRLLREQVTIDPRCVKQLGIRTIWTAGIANPDDFETLYVAGLRTVAVPARLNAMHVAEILTTGGWKSAPRALAETWAR